MSQVLAIVDSFGVVAPSGNVSGTLDTTHTGGIWNTTDDVTIPQTAGFNCVLVFGGAHYVGFGSEWSSVMASGDIMGIVVTAGPAIKAVMTPAASQVAFS